MEQAKIRVEHTGARKPNRIDAIRTDAGGELTANDAYELDLWRAALAEGRTQRPVEHPMTEKTTYTV